MQTNVLTQPPDLLQMLAHELRWQIIRLLSMSDLRVGEIIASLGQPANLVSYHLRLLRTNGLVDARRSDADGRDVYYSLNVPRLQSSYFGAGEQLHPALHVDVSCLAPAGLPVGQRRRVLFACTHNSARSQMAEALLRQAAGDAAVVYSAGSQPSQVHPMAVQVMAERGIDISHQQSKGFAELQDHRFHTVITVCDRAREVCPVLPDHPRYIHWSLPDPAQAGSSPEERYEAFRTTADKLEERIGHFLSQAGKEEMNELA